MNCKNMTDAIDRSAASCGLDLSKFGQTLTVQDLNAKADVNVGRRLHFGDETMSESPDMANNNSDAYYLQKTEHDRNKSTLDLTLNDDPDERFRILSKEDEKHYFRANGDAGHDGTLRVGGNVESDVFRFRKNNNQGGDKSSLEYNGNGGIDVYTDARFDIIESDKNRRVFRFDANNNRFCIGDTCVGENDISTVELKRKYEELDRKLSRNTSDTSELGARLRRKGQLLTGKIGSGREDRRELEDELRRVETDLTDVTDKDTMGKIQDLERELRDVKNASQGAHTGNLEVRGGDLDLCRSGNCNTDGGRLRTYYRNYGTRLSLEELDDEVSYEMKTHRNNDKAELTKARDGTVFIRNQNGHSMKLTPDGEFCLGGTCIDENALKTLNGQRPFTMRSEHRGMRLQDRGGNALFRHTNRKEWERMYFEQF